MKNTLLFVIVGATALCQDLTNDVYWESHPPEVRKLKDCPELKACEKQAEDLAKAGFKIDVPIMVFHWDAAKVMQMRKAYGFTWVPSALMPNIEIAPGLISHGLSPYDPDSPPTGSIKVSVDAKDYPKYDRPVPVATTPASIVGKHSIGNLYLTVSGDASPSGTVFADERGKFIKRVQAGPFGAWSYWEKI